MKKRLTSKQLDLVLKYLRDNKSGQFLNPKELKALKPFQNFSNDELNLITELLIHEELVKHNPGKGTNSSVVKLNAKGLAFLESGGYRRKKLNQNVNIVLKIISTGGIILGIILGGRQLFKSPLMDRINNLEKRIELLEK